MAERICHYYGRGFFPDPGLGDRQKACSLACQRLWKKENNRLDRENNPECWENHYEQYVKPWRQKRKRAVREKSLGKIKAAMGSVHNLNYKRQYSVQ